MSIKINNKALQKAQINGKEVQKIVINGNTVYQKVSYVPISEFTAETGWTNVTASMSGSQIFNVNNNYYYNAYSSYYRIYKYSSSKTWTQVWYSSTAKFGVSNFYDGSNIYYIGYAYQSSYDSTRVCYKFNPSTQQWTSSTDYTNGLPASNTNGYTPNCYPWTDGTHFYMTTYQAGGPYKWDSSQNKWVSFTFNVNISGANVAAINGKVVGYSGSKWYEWNATTEQWVERSKQWTSSVSNITYEAGRCVIFDGYTYYWRNQNSPYTCYIYDQSADDWVEHTITGLPQNSTLLRAWVDSNKRIIIPTGTNQCHIADQLYQGNIPSTSIAGCSAYTFCLI